MLGKIKDSAAYISRFLEGEKYRIGIILGTGLGELGKSIEIKHTIPYAGIPHFPVSTVQGHKGNLLIGKFGGKNVIAMQGRFHFYEGHPIQKVVFPVKVMKKIGVKTLIVTNAAGGVNAGVLRAQGVQVAAAVLLQEARAALRPDVLAAHAAAGRVAVEQEQTILAL